MTAIPHPKTLWNLNFSQTLTLLQHARLPTLAQAALLALATHVHVHFTVTVVLAGVLGTFNDAASKEALAALAAQHVVMETGGLVTTYTAHLIAKHLRSRPLLSLHWLTICTHIERVDKPYLALSIISVKENLSEAATPHKGYLRCAGG